MNDPSAPIIVAGHICLDLIPTFSDTDGGLEHLLAPGELVEVGSPVIATGGAVSNTGLALHRLGLPARLLGKVGDDLFGRAVRDVLEQHDGNLAEGLVVAPGEDTSYTLVVSPPGVDRAFMHCPGANHTYRADDVAAEQLQEAHLFHFGYPPLMRTMYADDGAEMASLLERIQHEGLLTSVDMAKPDPTSEAGNVDWRAWLENVLPHVDLFGPSLDEMLFMLGRPAEMPPSAYEAPDLLSEIAGRLLTLGANAVAIKLGSDGLYLRTAGENRRLHRHLPGRWSGREILSPCFETEVVGTTGAGDCTLAGLLAALSRQAAPEEALTLATAVGACSVEAPDSTSGIPRLEAVEQRIRDGWPRCAADLPPSWRRDEEYGVFLGPHDE